MLKAALVPQQLTPLLQDAACQVDGISRLLLPVTQSRRGTQTNASSMCLLYCFAYSQELVELRATREGSGKKAPVSVLCRKQQGGTTNLFDSNKKGSQVFWWSESAAVPECNSVQRLNVCCPLKTMYQLSQQHIHRNLFLKCKPLRDNMNILNFPHFERQNSKNKPSHVITHFSTSTQTSVLRIGCIRSIPEIHSWLKFGWVETIPVSGQWARSMGWGISPSRCEINLMSWQPASTSTPVDLPLTHTETCACTKIIPISALLKKNSILGVKTRLTFRS